MKTERMADHQVETQGGLRRLERRQDREGHREARISFVTSGIEDYSDAMARFSISPTPTPSFKGTMSEVAEALSQVEIVDPNIVKRLKRISKKDRKITEDDIAFTSSVASAKAKVMQNQEGLIPEEKKGLEQFKKTILKSAGKTIAGVGGGRVLRTATAFSLVLTASGCIVPPRTPEATQGVESVATEAVSTPTVLPSTEEVSRGKYGVEGGPAHGVEDPNTYNLEELVIEEDWEKIKNEVRIEDLDNGNRLIIYPLPWGCEVQEDGTNSQKFILVNRELHPDVHDVEVAAICDLDPNSPTYGIVITENYKKFSLDQLVEEVLSTSEKYGEEELSQEK